MREDAQLLPVIQWAGREFLVDVASRRFRNVNDAGDFIDMHSQSGREIVRQMRDAEWRVFAVAASDACAGQKRLVAGPARGYAGRAAHARF